MSRVILKQITAPNLPQNTVLQPRFANPTDPAVSGTGRTVRTAQSSVNIAPPVEFRIGIGGFIYLFRAGQPLCRSKKHINDRDGLTRRNQRTEFWRAPGNPLLNAHVGMILVYDILAEAMEPPGSPDGEAPGAPSDSDDLILQPFSVESDDDAIAGLLEGDELPLLESADLESADSNDAEAA